MKESLLLKMKTAIILLLYTYMNVADVLGKFVKKTFKFLLYFELKEFSNRIEKHFKTTFYNFTCYNFKTLILTNIQSK